MMERKVLSFMLTVLIFLVLNFGFHMAGIVTQVHLGYNIYQKVLGNSNGEYKGF